MDNLLTQTLHQRASIFRSIANVMSNVSAPLDTADSPILVRCSPIVQCASSAALSCVAVRVCSTKMSSDRRKRQETEIKETLHYTLDMQSQRWRTDTLTFLKFLQELASRAKISRTDKPVASPLSMEKFEFIVFIVIWERLLLTFNSASRTLQTVEIDLSAATTLLSMALGELT